jgi:hypothetical protein
MKRPACGGPSLPSEYLQPDRAARFRNRTPARRGEWRFVVLALTFHRPYLCPTCVSHRRCPFSFPTTSGASTNITASPSPAASSAQLSVCSTPRVQPASMTWPFPSITATPVSLARRSPLPSRQARSTPRKRTSAIRALYRTGFLRGYAVHRAFSRFAMKPCSSAETKAPLVILLAQSGSPCLGDAPGTPGKVPAGDRRGRRLVYEPCGYFAHAVIFSAVRRAGQHLSVTVTPATALRSCLSYGTCEAGDEQRREDPRQ